MEPFYRCVSHVLDRLIALIALFPLLLRCLGMEMEHLITGDDPVDSPSEFLRLWLPSSALHCVRWLMSATYILLPPSVTKVTGVMLRNMSSVTVWHRGHLCSLLIDSLLPVPYQCYLCGLALDFALTIPHLQPLRVVLADFALAVPHLQYLCGPLWRDAWHLVGLFLDLCHDCMAPRDTSLQPFVFFCSLPIMDTYNMGKAEPRHWLGVVVITLLLHWEQLRQRDDRVAELERRLKRKVKAPPTGRDMDGKPEAPKDARLDSLKRLPSLAEIFETVSPHGMSWTAFFDRFEHRIDPKVEDVFKLSMSSILVRDVKRPDCLIVEPESPVADKEYVRGLVNLRLDREQVHTWYLRQSDLERESKQYMESVTFLTQKNNRLMAAIEQGEARLAAQKEADVEAKLEESEQAVAMLTQKRNELRADLDVSQAELATTKAEVYRMNAKLEESAADIANLTLEKSALRADLRELAKFKAMVGQDNVKLEKCAEKIASLTRERDAARADLEEAKPQVAAAGTQKALMDQTNAKLAESTHKLASLGRERDALGARLERTEARLAERESVTVEERDAAERRIEGLMRALGKPRDNHLQRFLRIGDFPLPPGFGGGSQRSELTLSEQGDRVTLKNYKSNPFDFEFDHIFDEPRGGAIAATFQPYIENVAAGKTSIILTDGLSSSGKSHTTIEIAQEAGRILLRRSANGIRIKATEMLRDTTPLKSMELQKLQPHVTQDGEQYLVTSQQGLQAVLQHFEASRTVAKTAMNESSSRRHLLIEISMPVSPGYLFLLDVCGAERSHKVKDPLQEEGTKIINETRTEYRTVLQNLRTPNISRRPAQDSALAWFLHKHMKNVTCTPDNGKRLEIWPMAALVTHVNRRHPPELTYGPLQWSCTFARRQTA